MESALEPMLKYLLHTEKKQSFELHQILAGKQATFPVTPIGYDCPQQWNPPALWYPWNGWMFSQLLGPRFLTIFCNTRKWMSTQILTFTQVSIWLRILLKLYDRGEKLGFSSVSEVLLSSGLGKPFSVLLVPIYICVFV